MWLAGGADPALPVGGSLMSEPQDAASESMQLVPSLVQDVVELEDLAGQHHADKQAVRVDDRQAIDVRSFHDGERLTEVPLGSTDGHVGTHYGLNGQRAPLVPVDGLDLVQARHAQVCRTFDDGHRGLPAADEVLPE